MKGLSFKIPRYLPTTEIKPFGVSQRKTLTSYHSGKFDGTFFSALQQKEVDANIPIKTKSQTIVREKDMATITGQWTIK